MTGPLSHRSCKHWRLKIRNVMWNNISWCSLQVFICDWWKYLLCKSSKFEKSKHSPSQPWNCVRSSFEENDVLLNSVRLSLYFTVKEKLAYSTEAINKQLLSKQPWLSLFVCREAVLYNLGHGGTWRHQSSFTLAFCFACQKFHCCTYQV